MWSRAELKTNAKAALKNNFGSGLLALILASVIAGAGAMVYYIVMMIVAMGLGVSEYLTNVSGGSVSAEVTSGLPEGAYVGFYILMLVMYMALFVYEIIVAVPISVGSYRFFQKSRGVPTSVSEIFVPLKKCGHVAWVMFLMVLKVWLWSLLLVVPGIIKAYEYSMVPYILAENPQISTKRAFEFSKAMTDGHKFDLFVLQLSFILWELGCCCTCGLLLIYVGPYMYATYVEAYYRLKAEAVAKGAVNLMELPDIYAPQQVVPPTAPTV